MSGKDKIDVEVGSAPTVTSVNENRGSKDKDKGAGLLQMSSARRWKLLFCFVGLQLSYILWGVVQENLMTQKYEKGSFKSSAFCVFGNRFLALFISLGIVLFRKWRNTSTGNEAPYYQYLPSSLSNSLSSWAQYEALKYISFPTQVLSKSCKIIPVMLVGYSFIYSYRCNTKIYIDD
jgi:adenosine 3'-phospho 5'-phosphosulfate transporter B2